MNTEKQNLQNRLSEIEKEIAGIKFKLSKEDKKEQPKTLRERVTSVENAIKELPADDEDVKVYRALETAGIGGHNLAYQQLVIVCKAMCNGKHLTEDDERYSPWFDLTKTPGACFSLSYYDYWSSLSDVSSRLTLSCADDARYVGQQFESIWYTYIMSNPT